MLLIMLQLLQFLSLAINLIVYAKYAINRQESYPVFQLKEMHAM